MPPRSPASALATPLSSLGLSGAEERLYARLLPLSGGSVASVAAALNLPTGELAAEIEPLSRLGICRIDDGHLVVLALADALSLLIRREAARAASAEARLTRLAEAVPLLAASVSRPGTGDVDDVVPIEGEVSSGGNALQLLSNLISESRGDLLWLRPDAWRMPREGAMVEVITAAIAKGRRSRAIYPVVALSEAPDVLRARARAGEQIRLLPDLPTRLMVIGTTHAVVPEPLGYADEPRLLVRQGALVESLILLFEELWARASPVPEMDNLAGGEARPDLRRFLLQLLAAGQKDEQIARTLGMSLRTVRRRIADVMSELGADSRFQAGVEAIRRGWI
ncbi:helix-turn-helix domain-containing protein [Nocardioides bigeumensis]|uniref:HTH luxR-type domain-containing protein n=1 Tax=Nocardioides bigeumensis TaxID=433657 RepID=A0ABN2YFU5_9ACTN